MKALLYTGVGKVEICDIPEPVLQPGTMKMRVDYCAICGSDIHLIDHGMGGAKPPQLIGHEGCGTIVEVSDGMEQYGWKVGDRVACAAYSPCGGCDDCKRGETAMCEYRDHIRMFTKYILVKPNMIFKIPDGADPLPYCLAEPSACAIRGIDIADPALGDTVAISGVGGIGSIILNMLVLRGGTKITVFDPVPEKRQLALELGADYVADPFTEDIVAKGKEFTGGRGYDVVFEVSGSPKAAPLMPELIAKRGKIMYFAVYPEQYELPLNLYKLYEKEGSVYTAFTSIANYPRVMNLIPKMRMDKIIGKVMPLEQGPEAFELFRKSIHPKIVLKCSDL